MSCILGIDTSSAELSIGLICDGKQIASYSRYARNSHAEHIAQATMFLIEKNKIKPSDITLAGIACGPGSFTGLRTGLAFAKGFFTNDNIPILPISSIHSVVKAWNHADGLVSVAFDARRDNVFSARFKIDKGIISRLSEDELITIEEFCKRLEPNENILIDNMGYTRSTVFDTIKEVYDNIYSIQSMALNRGLACANIASNEPLDSKLWISTLELQPNYHQKSYVEISQKK